MIINRKAYNYACIVLALASIVITTLAFAYILGLFGVAAQLIIAVPFVISAAAVAAMTICLYASNLPK